MPLTVGLLVFPAVEALDLLGPREVFAGLPGAQVVLLWKDRQPLKAASGLPLSADLSFAECPPLDLLCVPGGAGVNPLLGDAEVVDFLRVQAGRARLVASVCTGALLLGAAGLLAGRRATTHWNSRDLLPAFGATPVAERVVRDGTLFTAAGITAGIDLALILTAELAGRAVAEATELTLEYDPRPPFGSGTPETAPAAALAACQARYARLRAEREAFAAGFARR